MKIMIETDIEVFPETCDDDCPLFIDSRTLPPGVPWYCALGFEYTEEEIQDEEDGKLSMYYHGCLNHRPKSCTLKEVKE